MKLQENIERIKEMMGLTESKFDNILQSITDGVLEDLQGLTREMGLGEMDELDEIESVDEIKVNSFVNNDIPIVHVDFYVNSGRRNYDNIVYTLEYEIGKYIPQVKVSVSSIIDTRNPELMDKVIGESKSKKVKCGECGWSWKLSEGGDDPYVCHKCGFDNSTKKGEITEKCWKGYEKKGMKTMFGKRYPNCVKKKK